MTLNVGEILKKAAGGELLNEAEAAALLSAPTAQHAAILDTARDLRRELHGERVSYIVNRNLNFTNVCDRHCTFCGFMRRETDEDHYRFTLEECFEKAAETPWVDEFCIQGGIDTAYDFDFYLDLSRGLKERFPHAHLHAFSPEEIHALHLRTGRDVADLISRLMAAGVDSMPGTAAEILHPDVRRRVAGRKLTGQDWVDVVKTAHRLGHPSTATILFGHIETPAHVAHHLGVIRAVQQQTGLISEFVPLLFVPTLTRLGKTTGRTEVISREAIERFYAVARLFMGRVIGHLQVSWVKLGEPFAISLLDICDDYSGTLYEESITRLAGGGHGTGLSERRILSSLQEAGFTPWRRATLYEELPTPSPHAERFLGEKWHSATPEAEAATAHLSAPVVRAC